MKFQLNSVNQNQNKMPLGLATEEGRKGRNERKATATTSARKNENCAIDTPTVSDIGRQQKAVHKYALEETEWRRICPTTF